MPRYLTPASPPEVPLHAGTLDVDVVLNLQVLTTDEAYKSLAHQLKDRGFKRYVNREGKPSSWRWQLEFSEHQLVLVEFLRDESDDLGAGSVASIEGEGVSALAIRHVGIVHDWFLEKEITAELPDNAGTATETVRYADPVAFIILKALAFNDRQENKDAADLIHVMRYVDSIHHVAETFRQRKQEGKFADAIEAAVNALRIRFCGGPGVEGYRRDGPVAHTTFMFGDGDPLADERILEQRYASALVEDFLKAIEKA